jgi:hypothetical protein
MDAVLHAGAALVPGGLEGLIDDLLAGSARDPAAIDKPARPLAIPAATWRRMSRLSRLLAVAAVPLIADRSDLHELAIVWGTSLGELVPTSQLTQRLYREGPRSVSPMAFQNSVYNAPIGHLSISLGLRGPSETVCAGGASGLTALMRGISWLRAGAPAALVVAGDVTAPLWERAWELRAELEGRPHPLLGEAVAAVLLVADGPGPRVQLHAGARPTGLTLTRRCPLPGERPPSTLPGALPLEGTLGLSGAAGLAGVVALMDRGGAVVDWDDGRALTATVTP